VKLLVDLLSVSSLGLLFVDTIIVTVAANRFCPVFRSLFFCAACHHTNKRGVRLSTSMATEWRFNVCVSVLSLVDLSINQFVSESIKTD